MDSNNNSNSTFKPYIPAEKIMPEMTVLSVIMGCLLAIVFGAANAYLGLRVGMTVSASIPAAVISMGVIRVIMKRDSILENNYVQTLGSAGESLAAGAIFTLPAMFLWAKEGLMDKPNLIEIMLLCLVGGLLGVFFMVPLRNALIVKEHGVLPYPEGTACAEVLLAGEEGGESAKTVFAGLGIAAAFKFVIDGLKAVPSEINTPSHGIGNYGGQIGTQIYPAVFSVGYICGSRISSYMFSGGLISWLFIIPLIVLFGGDAIMYPGTAPISQMFAEGGTSAIWGSYVRYVGAGALAAGGIISLIKSLPLIVRTFRDSMKDLAKGQGSSALRTDQNLSMKTVIICIAVIIVVSAFLPQIPVGIGGAILITIFGFFFASVSSRMVGIVGSSNNPVSGMAIATLLFSTIILKACGDTGASGMKTAIAIGTIICIIAAIAGDTSQDLKTGYLVGATPKKQQIGEIIGVIVSAVTIGVVLYLLDAAWGFGSKELGAPQAILMKMIIEGIMGGKLPWALVITGIVLAVVVEILGIPVLPFAIGVYLPVQLNACIMIGGLVRLYFDKKKYRDEKEKKSTVNRGILYCSGMIAGEGIIGIVLAILAVAGVSDAIDLSAKMHLSPAAGTICSALVFAFMIYLVVKFTFGKKKAAKAETDSKD
ncbi:MAG: oligopeptide transporter, OPT family [Lachnospiraceae bacterium]|nr:oligopeptide transporter, OPT family [Lachnospiraceae bacterium]MEE3461228.1 oligopeptide transporter, OPT family [Lachnospiraceae bacterium]